MVDYVPIIERTKTIFIDLDGTIFRQGDRWPSVEVDPEKDLLPGVKEKFTEWHMRGDRIVVMTARSQAYRRTTEYQLRQAQLHWDILLMGLPTGQRVLINDRKPEERGTDTAIAVNLDRDEGMEELKL